VKRAVTVAAGAVLGLAAVAYLWAASYLDAPVGKSATVLVERGATLKSVLEDLRANGAIDKPRLVYIYARLTEQTDVRTGEYDVAAEQTPKQIVAALSRGMVKTAHFTIAEGLNRWQVRDLLGREHWIDAAEFDRLCDSMPFLSSHGVPGPTCEGYLFPETYTFARGVPAEKIFATLFATYERAFASSTTSGRGPLSLDERQLVTLASIVEKETGAPEERPRIACLFYNRLRAKPPWRLDTDPTVIYAATLADPTFDGNIKKKHLSLEHPYNTYRNTGLPPGPIANPGRAALQAVVQPDTCGDFFFVSMNNGRHVFCPDLRCHEAAVRKWQVEYFQRKD
jgi:UPF0755 protein